MSLDVATAAQTFKENFYTASCQLFRDDPDYKDVHVAFGWPGTFKPVDIVAWGGVRTEQEVANESSSNRSRNEWIYLDVTCSAFVGGGEEAEILSSRRSFALLRKLEYFARITDTTIGGVVDYCFIDKTDSEGATDPKTLAKGRNVFVGATFKAKARITGRGTP